METTKTGEVIARGAEAVIRRKSKSLLKERISKSYRHKQIDQELRSERTRREAKLLERALRAGVPVPKVLEIDKKNMTIIMEEIQGDKLKDLIDKGENVNDIFSSLGKSVATLHENGIIHGDLTTSNIIVKDNVPFLIDFGLGSFSTRIEDMAMDVVLLKDVINSSHPGLELWSPFKDSYSKFLNSDQVMKRLSEVENRGRYTVKN